VLPVPVLPVVAEPALVDEPMPRAPPPPPPPPITEPPPKPKFDPVWADAVNGLAARTAPRRSASNTLPRINISVE